MNKMPYIIAGNWKMNKTIQEAIHFAEKVATAPGVQSIIFPPALTLPALSNYQNQFAVGAQNIHSAENGAFTGELSAEMVFATGANYTLVGHSERRQLFGETSRDVNDKALAALRGGLCPIICVGETLTDRENNETLIVIEEQLNVALRDINSTHFILAYEPVWAIGTGKTASPEQAQDVHAYIRKKLIAAFPAEGAAIPILYGGSVKSANIQSLLSKADINGALIGGASLDIDEFNKMIQLTSELNNE
jgi:triosephosphate isomerase